MLEATLTPWDKGPMRLVLFAFPAAILVGYLTGGRLGNLTALTFRWPVAGLGGIALQFAPFAGTAATLLLLASFLLLLATATVNRRLPGFILILAGLGLNFLVIAANGGMPVTRHALAASGQTDTLAALEQAGGAKHHLATDADVLIPLGDVIPVPAPVRQVVSVGDVLAYGGSALLIVQGMRRRPATDPREGPPLMDPAEAS